MFALFEDDFTIIHWTAGFAAFVLPTMINA